MHLYYQDLWPEFWLYLKDIKNEKTDLYVTINDDNSFFYNDIKEKATEVFLVENRGMDFGGFLFAYNKIKNTPYSVIIKLHGKKRHPYANFSAENWRRFLCSPLISSKEIYSNLVKKFENNNRLYMYGSHFFYRNELCTHPWLLENMPFIYKINKILNLKYIDEYNFIAGSMFAVSPTYLNLLFNNKEMDLYSNLSFGAPINGSIAHGLERLIGANVGLFGGDMELSE